MLLSFLIFTLSHNFLIPNVILHGTLDVPTGIFPTIHRCLLFTCSKAHMCNRNIISYTYIFIIFTIGLFSIMLQFPFFLLSQIFLNLKQTRDIKWTLGSFQHLKQHILISNKFIQISKDKIKLKINLKRQRFDLSISHE